MVTLEINVPKAIMPFVVDKDSDMQLKRNALFLYPYIENNTISHGRAAELLGMRKLELIALYGTMGLAYFNMDMDEVEKDAEAVRELRSKTR